MKDNKGILYIIIAFTIASLLFWSLNHNVLGRVPDTESYEAPAYSIIQKHSFNNTEGKPDTNRTLGYPLLMSLVFAFGGGLDTIVFVQILLSALCLYLTYSTCTIMGTAKQLTITCCALYALDLLLYIYQCYIASDILFLDLLVISLHFLVRYYNDNRIRWFLLFSLLINCALLVRPILIYYNILLLIFLLVLFLIRKIDRRALIIYCACFSILVGGWCTRNYMVSGVFEYSSIRNYNLLICDASILRSDVEDITIYEARDAFQKEMSSENDLDSLNESQLRQIYGKYGTEYIRKHFPQYIMQNIKGLLNEMFGPGRSFIEETIQSVVLRYVIMGTYCLYLLAVYTLYVIGLIRNINTLNTIDWFVFTVSGYCAIASASLGYSRFRVAWFALILTGAFLLISKHEEVFEEHV